MHHFNLKNHSYFDINGAANPSWETPPNTTFACQDGQNTEFKNLRSTTVENLVDSPVYWSGMTYTDIPATSSNSIYALYFNFTTGKQHCNMHDHQFAWAVRNGDSNESTLAAPTLRIVEND